MLLITTIKQREASHGVNPATTVLGLEHVTIHQSIVVETGAHTCQTIVNSRIQGCNNLHRALHRQPLHSRLPDLVGSSSLTLWLTRRPFYRKALTLLINPIKLPWTFGRRTRIKIYSLITWSSLADSQSRQLSTDESIPSHFDPSDSLAFSQAPDGSSQYYSPQQQPFYSYPM